MIKQKVFCLLAAGVLLNITGCQCLNSVFCCQPACGGDAVGYPSAGYGGASYGAGGYEAGVYDAGGCGGCEGGCNSCARPCFPLVQKIFVGLQAIKRCVVCHGCADGCSGCGEKYWSEWHNDPPSCGDPCDGCGNWTGCRSGAYQAPYSVTPYAEPQGVPTEAPEPPGSQAGYYIDQQPPVMSPAAGYRSYRHPGRIAVGI